MSRHIKTRVLKLEQMQAPRKSAILVASHRDEAARLLDENLGAVVIVTGVPR
jgi:hypothetical protein